MFRSWGRLGRVFMLELRKKYDEIVNFRVKNFFFEFRAHDFESLEQALQPPETIFWTR